MSLIFSRVDGTTSVGARATSGSMIQLEAYPGLLAWLSGVAILKEFGPGSGLNSGMTEAVAMATVTEATRATMMLVFMMMEMIHIECPNECCLFSMVWSNYE